MEDLDRLVPVILERQGARMGLRVTLTPAGFAALRAHRWPGNVRELENALERAAVLSPDGVIDAQSLDLRGAPSLEPEPEGVAGALTDLRSVVRVAEREALARALDAAGGNRRRAAQLLGISVRALFYKLKDHGLSEQ
jgi:DNA-binding NtrC family response regulator